MIKEIESRANSTYKYLLSLLKSHSENQFLIYGDDLIDEARKANSLDTVIVYDKENIREQDKEDIIVLTHSLYKELCSYKSLPLRLGVAHIEERMPNKGDVVYLDNVQDPGNVGTIIRTALAFSYSGVILSKNSVNLNSIKLVQASKGAIFHIPVIKCDLDKIDLKSYHIIGTSLKGKDASCYKRPEKNIMIVLGNEGQGISSEVEKQCDDLLLLPIKGIDSLNVSAAASIFIYMFRR